MWDYLKQGVIFYCEIWDGSLHDSRKVLGPSFASDATVPPLSINPDPKQRVNPNRYSFYKHWFTMFRGSSIKARNSRRTAGGFLFSIGNQRIADVFGKYMMADDASTWTTNQNVFHTSVDAILRCNASTRPFRWYSCWYRFIFKMT